MELGTKMKKESMGIINSKEEIQMAKGVKFVMEIQIMRTIISHF